MRNTAAGIQSEIAKGAFRLRKGSFPNLSGKSFF